jgi:hypothetical protein
VTDVNANRFDIVIWLITPNLFEDERGSNRLTMTLEQTMKKLEFQVGEADGMIEPNGLKTFWYQG